MLALGEGKEPEPGVERPTGVPRELEQAGARDPGFDRAGAELQDSFEEDERRIEALLEEGDLVPFPVEIDQGLFLRRNLVLPGESPKDLTNHARPTICRNIEGDSAASPNRLSLNRKNFK